MTDAAWPEETQGGVLVIRPSPLPRGLVVAFSGRGTAPANEPSPTSLLGRQFADALGLEGVGIVRATQVHGNRAVAIREMPETAKVRDAGECDALVTDLDSVALVVQTADCVPIALAGERAIGIVHAGWKGSAANAAAAGVGALAGLGEKSENLRAWLGPSIGACCYEVGGEVAAQFAGEFVRAGCGGAYRLDLRAVNRAQLEAAGVRPENIFVHAACTKCGGECFASYRREGAKSGSMIALVMRT
jgi:purine-nucleoside/S-methyl-5'-thioadenosine phosphorylase / adenosine deaminase